MKLGQRGSISCHISIHLPLFGSQAIGLTAKRQGKLMGLEDFYPQRNGRNMDREVAFCGPGSTRPDHR